jgi:hypothetical protein
MRSAIIRSGFQDPAKELERVRRYLPSNYSAVYDETRDCIVVAGTDQAGWTLDGFVLPRLASGLIFASEVTA